MSVQEWLGCDDHQPHITVKSGHIRNETVLEFGGDFSKTIEYTFNSYGFRCKELSRSGLISVGCSICCGVGVRENERVSAKLANHLNLEDYNIAFPGKSIDYCFRMLDWAVPLFLPKFVFIQAPADSRREHIDEFGAYDFVPNGTPIFDGERQRVFQEYRDGYSKIYNAHQNAIHFYQKCRAIEHLLERYKIPWLMLLPKKLTEDVAQLMQKNPRYVKLVGSIDLGSDNGHPGPESHALWTEGLIQMLTKHHLSKGQI